MLSPGDIVISTAGREKDNYFVVVDVQDNFAFICDGKSRKIDKPKMKKIKHLSSVIGHSEFVSVKINKGEPVTNKEIKKELKSYAEHNL